MNINKGLQIACDGCGAGNTLFGTGNWGNLTLQGRVISSSNNLHLSPPGGKKVYINDAYRAAGGSSDGEAGLSVAGETWLALAEGNVGVGTSSPIAKLDIQSSGTLGGKYDASKAYFRIGDGHNDMLMDGNEIIGNSSLFIASGASPGQDIYFRNVDTNGAEDLMIIKSEGNVGIGTTSPAAKLEVQGDILYHGAIIAHQTGQNNNVDHLWHDDAPAGDAGGTWHFSSDLGYKASGNSRLQAAHIYMTAETQNNFIAGKLGIGNSSPAHPLDVSGNIRASGTLYASGGNSANWNSAFGWGDHGAAGYLENGQSPDFGNGMNLRGPDPAIHFNDNNNYGATFRLNSGLLSLFGHTPSNTDTHDGGWDRNGAYWPIRINMTNDQVELGGSTYVQEGDFFVRSGNAGVGTTTPTSKLHVKGDTRYGSFDPVHRLAFFESSKSGSDASIAIKGYRNGSLGTASFIDFDVFDNNEPSGTEYINMARIGAGKEAADGQNGQLRFYTNNNGSVDEQMRIVANGHVGIGTTSPSHNLEVAGNTKITGNLLLDGDLVYGPGIDPDPSASRLLALDGFNKMVYHELDDVRNPWGLRFVQDAMGTGLNCMEFEDLDTNLTIEVDVLDIHGNLLLGNNGYIDDRDIEFTSNPADQIWAGDHNNQRDDWIHIAERIELSSNSNVGEGVVIFGKNTTSTQFLNLTQDGNDSYLANSKGLNEYFIKATDRNVTFGGHLSMPTGSLATLHNLTVNQNATIIGRISTDDHGSSADWHATTTTVNGGAANWNTAYTNRVVAASGLSWDSTNKDLSVNIGDGLAINPSNQLEIDESAINITAGQVIGLPWDDSNSVLTYTGSAKVTAAFEAQNLTLTGLGGGDKDLDQVMVISSDGTVKNIAPDELGGNSPWSVQPGAISYTGAATLNGDLILPALPKGNTYDRVLVEDGTGIIGYRELSSFDLSPWTRDIDDNLSYNAGNISTIKSLISEVGTDEIAFIARGAGEDNFRVYGNGDIKARDLVLDQDDWPDYVFKDDYELRSIEEVETFVKENKHLPDVPSEDEILENGMSVGEMNKVLLQKVEELTLYIIEQNNTIKAQQEEIQDQKNDFAARLEAIEQKIGQ